jgi:diguanylate cyclase (GGDEF)-like protein
MADFGPFTGMGRVLGRLRRSVSAKLAVPVVVFALVTVVGLHRWAALRERTEVSESVERRADDLRRALAHDFSGVVVDRSGETGGDPNVAHVVTPIASPILVAGQTDGEAAVARLTFDISDLRAGAAAETRRDLAVAVALVLSLATVFLATARFILVRRLRRLTADIEAIGRGQAHSRLDGYGTDEIGRLADAYGRALFDINQRGEQIVETTRWLEDEVARRQAAEAETRHQLRHDALTGLANRSLALEYAAASIAVCDWNREHAVAALHINLDRFKVVNDSLGHEAGDRVLKEISRRLVMAIGRDDLAARVSGDEFVVVVDERRDPEVTALAETLIRTLEYPVELGDGNDVFGSASVGIAKARPGDDAEALFRKAGMASTRAKESGRARFEWFDDDMRSAIEARVELEVALRYAIEGARPGDSELELHYQPIIDLAAGRVRGFESLVRWRRNGDLVAPGEFIELAEDTGLIVPLGSWILKEAAAQAGRWQRQFPDLPPVVTINVSGLQLSAGGVPALMRAAITANRLDPTYITVELTESVLLDDVDRARSTLEELKALGVKLAADDFGTGYSSLTYLRQFPFDVVKVDQSFVRNLGDDTQDSTIVAAVIAMARALGLRVVCEGVETTEHLAGLMVLGADDGQGWYFAKALTATEAAIVYRDGLDSLHPASPTSA